MPQGGCGQCRCVAEGEGVETTSPVQLPGAVSGPGSCPRAQFSEQGKYWQSQGQRRRQWLQSSQPSLDSCPFSLGSNCCPEDPTGSQPQRSPAAQAYYPDPKQRQRSGNQQGRYSGQGRPEQHPVGEQQQRCPQPRERSSGEAEEPAAGHWCVGVASGPGTLRSPLWARGSVCCPSLCLSARGDQRLGRGEGEGWGGALGKSREPAEPGRVG